MCSVHVVLVLLYCYCLQYPILDIWWIRYSNTASSNVVFILWSWSWRNFEMRKFSSSATTQSQLNSANKLLNSELNLIWCCEQQILYFSQLEVKKSWGRKFLEDFSGILPLVILTFRSLFAWTNCENPWKNILGYYQVSLILKGKKLSLFLYS